MKLRFYVDLPEWDMVGWNYIAMQNPCSQVMAGWQRVAFDVDVPPFLLKKADIGAPTTLVGVVPSLHTAPEGGAK